MSASTEKKNRQAAREAGTDKKTNAVEREKAMKKKSSLRWTLGTVLVVLLIAAILFLNSGFLYTGTTAIRVGDEKYSPAEVNYRYSTQYLNWVNQYGSYASMFGIDPKAGTAGLKNAPCSFTEEGTWRDYFLDMTVGEMTQVKAIKDYAAAEGIELSEDEKTDIEAEFSTIESFAKMQGYSSVDNFLSANYGEGVDNEIALEGACDSALVAKTIKTYTDSLSYTDKELREHYDSFNGDRDVFDIVYYAAIAEKVAGENEDDEKAATEETIAAAKAEAEAVLAAYKEQEDGDVEARMNAAIKKAGAEGQAVHNDSASGASLGTYRDWAMGSRSEGDVTLVENTAGDGYFVAAFVSRSDNSYRLAQVRHILVKAQPDENGEYTEAAKAEAKAKAEDIYKEWKSGAATEESFGVLASEHSEDPGSKDNGGLYDAVMKGQMVEEFDKFCFEGHKSGDTAIVYGEVPGGYAGYHIMYYVGEGDVCSDYIAKNDLVNTNSEEWLSSLVENYEADRCFWLKLVG
ncbi:MAG: peptidylprolyl isomerase [Candidatus Limivicinus sp.]|jgi:hypothetical protein